MKKITLLIVDDSPVERELLKFIAESDPAIEVIGFATNGIETLEFVKKTIPDVILMDIHMPLMDGFEATRRIMLNRPIPIVICSADYRKSDLDKSFEALQAGALAILEKPRGVLDPKFNFTQRTYVETIKMVSEVKLITRKFSQDISQKKAPIAPKLNRSISAIGIGASLGGPQALQSIFSQLSPLFPIPIYVVQHIADDFAEGLASWLMHTSKLPVHIAKNEEKGKPGHIYLAPGKACMEISKDHTIKISNANGKEQLGPTISVLFHSLAKSYEERGLGVILTGMGRDGVDGLLEMKKQGALTIAQSREDCIMYGMPREAINIGAAIEILALKDIPAYLNEICL